MAAPLTKRAITWKKRGARCDSFDVNESHGHTFSADRPANYFSKRMDTRERATFRGDNTRREELREGDNDSEENNQGGNLNICNSRQLIRIPISG